MQKEEKNSVKEKNKSSYPFNKQQQIVSRRKIWKKRCKKKKKKREKERERGREKSIIDRNPIKFGR